MYERVPAEPAPGRAEISFGETATAPVPIPHRTVHPAHSFGL
jgi:hypothetical protein